MEKYITLLRGINVSGQKKIKMADLKASLLRLDLINVETYIQSGNVIFEANEKSQDQLSVLIHEAILEDFGFEVPVLVRTIEDWKNTFENNPFVSDRNEDITKLHVAMLSEEPDPSNLEKLLAYDPTPEEFEKRGLNVYFFCPNGYGRSKIDNNIVERKLKVSATTRNWKTVTKLLELATN